MACSGVGTYGALGHVPPRVLEVLCILQLLPAYRPNCKNLENYQRKTYIRLHFRLSCQKHTKTHVNMLKQSRNWKKSGQGRRGKNLRCASSPHFLPTPLMAWLPFYRKISGESVVKALARTGSRPKSRYIKSEYL